MDCTNCLGDCNGEKNNITSQELPPIVGGFLNLTQKCNLKCKYCFVVQQPVEMEYQVAKDAVDFFARNATETGDIPSVNYFGGEPLLRWDDVILPLSKYIRETYGSNYSIGLTTNGILLDKDKLEIMRDLNIGFLFSIDGDKATQDRNRPFHNGRGSFDSLIDKIPMFLRYNPNATFRATVEPDGVHEMAHNYKFAAELGYTNIFMIPNVFTEWSAENMQELRKQVYLIAEMYMGYIREDRNVTFSGFESSYDKIKQINSMEINNAFRNSGDKYPAFGTCGLGGTKFASVGPSGTIYSCQEMVENPTDGDTFKIGNIYTTVDDTKRWEIIKGFDPKLVRRSDGASCEGCSMYRVCKGACTINNYFANGDLNIMPSVLCDYYQYSLDAAIYVMNRMSEEKNLLFKSLVRGRLT